MNMKKLFLIPLFACCFSFTYGQENPKNWISSGFVNAMVNSKVNYTYHDTDRWQEMSLTGKGAIELSYNLDFKFSRRLSIGALAGYTHINEPAFSSLKIGSALKFFYVKDKNYYLTFQYGYHIPFNRDKFREGHQIKIGQYFDVARISNYRLLLGFFYNYDFFYLDNPLFIPTNRGESILFHSYGISLGINI